MPIDSNIATTPAAGKPDQSTGSHPDSDPLGRDVSKRSINDGAQLAVRHLRIMPTRQADDQCWTLDDLPQGER